MTKKEGGGGGNFYLSLPSGSSWGWGRLSARTDGRVYRNGLHFIFDS